MRIGLLGTRGIPANYGGFETFAEELSSRLAERGHSVTVYCREKPDENVYKGVHLRHLPTWRHKYFDTIVHTGISTADALFRSFDVLLYCNAANAIFSLCPRLIAVPTALNVDGLERHRKKWNYLAKTWYQLSEWMATWCCSAVITDAEKIREYYRERYGKNSLFIPYGAEVGKVAGTEALTALGLQPGNYALYVSRLEPENNALQVREAFEKVRTTQKLALVGDAPYAADYIRRVRETTDPRIVMPGAIYGEGYRQLQSHCSVYVQATEVGGTHPALIEAMGRGALVLYLNTPENEEVAGDSGVPFENDLVQKLQWAVELSEAERARWGEKAMGRVKRLYSWDAVTDSYERLFPQTFTSVMNPYRSWVEISRAQISENFRAIRQAVGPGTEVMPVVKADAYRHGAVEVSRILEKDGANWLAVSSTEEGVILREAGIRARILVMADFLPFTREMMLAHGLTPVIHSLDDLQELDRLAKNCGERSPYHLKVDTGMGRLGVAPDAEKIAGAIRGASHVDFEGLMTHFASAANYESGQTDEQLQLFQSIAEALERLGLRPGLLHSSSTIPLAYGRRSAWQSMVRPGHAVYGYVSPARGEAPEAILQVKPALTWRASILAVKEVAAGALIGYGGMYRAPRPMRIAVLAAGYADGIPHRLSNRGSVILKGRIVPMLGAVSMDLTTVDVSQVPDVAVGDAATLLGSEGSVSIDAQQIAKWAGTISYSVLCGIHARVKRIYK